MRNVQGSHSAPFGNRCVWFFFFLKCHRTQVNLGKRLILILELLRLRFTAMTSCIFTNLIGYFFKRLVWYNIFYIPLQNSRIVLKLYFFFTFWTIGIECSTTWSLQINVNRIWIRGRNKCDASFHFINSFLMYTGKLLKYCRKINK